MVLRIIYVGEGGKSAVFDLVIGTLHNSTGRVTIEELREALRPQLQKFLDVSPAVPSGNG